MDEAQVLDARFKKALEQDIAEAWLIGWSACTQTSGEVDASTIRQAAEGYAKRLVRGNDA